LIALIALAIQLTGKDVPTTSAHLLVSNQSKPAWFATI
jgi:hypothetical protein